MVPTGVDDLTFEPPAREDLTTWARWGVTTVGRTYEYTLLFVILGVITTVADRGGIRTGEQADPLLVELLDVPFIRTALRAELPTESLVTVMVVAIVLFVGLTALLLPVFHLGTIPVSDGVTTYALSVPDLTVFGVGITPLLFAVPAVVLGVTATNRSREQPAPSTVATYLWICIVVGLVHTAVTFVGALLGRELVFATLTAISGAATPPAGIVHIPTVSTVGVVFVYAVVLTGAGLIVGRQLHDGSVAW